MQLENLGWNSEWARAFEPYDRQVFEPARVFRAHRESYLVRAAEAEREAEVTGRLRFAAEGAEQWPAVGDWVALIRSAPLIHAVLPRRTAFVRKDPGERVEKQVLAANVDVVFIMSALDRDFNPSRLERYLTLARESGAQAVFVLNKADLTADPAPFVQAARDVSRDVPLVLMSASSGQGVERIAEFLGRGVTGALIGSSGVGKSTLINRLLGRPAMTTREVRESDHRGRHATTHREILELPGAGLLMDLPGLRELQLWGDAETAENAFEDIAALAAGCRFGDCRHEGEPACAVRAAVESGALDPRRLENFRKLGRELRFLAARLDEQAALQERHRVKALHRSYRQIQQHARDTRGKP